MGSKRVRVQESHERQAMQVQAQQGWLHMAKLEEPARVRSREMGLLMGEERASRVAMPDKATRVLTMEAAAARRRQGLLPGPSWWGEGNASGREGWWGEDPPRRCSAAHPTGGGTTHATTSTQPTPTARFGQGAFRIAAHACTAQTTQSTTERRTGNARSQTGVVWGRWRQGKG